MPKMAVTVQISQRGVSFQPNRDGFSAGADATRLFPCFCADLTDSLDFEEVLGLRGFLVGLSVVSVDFFLTINGAFVSKQRRLSHACMQKPASYSHSFISLSFSLFQL